MCETQWEDLGVWDSVRGPWCLRLSEITLIYISETQWNDLDIYLRLSERTLMSETQWEDLAVWDSVRTLVSETQWDNFDVWDSVKWSWCLRLCWLSCILLVRRLCSLFWHIQLLWMETYLYLNVVRFGNVYDWLNQQLLLTLLTVLVTVHKVTWLPAHALLKLHLFRLTKCIYLALYLQGDVWPRFYQMMCCPQTQWVCNLYRRASW